MKPTHYAYRNSAGGVYVKEAEFFEEQGGKTKGWGSRWRPVIARDLAHARLIAETYAGELRWPMGAREQPPLRDELDKAVTVEGHLALSRRRMREAALRGSSSRIAEAKEVPGVKSHADYSGLEDRLLAGYVGAPYPEAGMPSWPGGTVTGRFEVGPDMQTIKKKRDYSSPSITVPPGQTPLNDDLTHPLLDVIDEGIKARDGDKPSRYHGHSLEHCLHAFGWVKRDLQLALLRQNERSVDPWTRQAGNELIEALKEWMGEIVIKERCPDGTPRLGKWEAENLYRKATAFLKLISE